MEAHWHNVLAILEFFWPYLLLITARVVTLTGWVWLGGFLLLVAILVLIFRELKYR